MSTRLTREQILSVIDSCCQKFVSNAYETRMQKKQDGESQAQTKIFLFFVYLLIPLPIKAWIV
jgi:hypothetical protein